MAVTVQNICDRARGFIKDEAKDRYPDDDADPVKPNLKRFVNDAVIYLRARRPELFIGSFSALPDGTLTLGATVPLDDMVIPSLVDYVVARAEALDDEHTLDGRALAFLEFSAEDRADKGKVA